MVQKQETTQKPRREKGTGTIWKKENGTWMGRIDIGKSTDGKRKFKNFSGKTEAEVKRKIREYNKTERKVDYSKISVETYVNNWLTTYKRNTIKDSSYDALEKTVRNYVIPHLGVIRLQELTSDDIQNLLQSLKDSGYSYSTVKKAHNCLNEFLRHATIKKDIADNPMLLVKMLSASEFEKKEIRYFTEAECALIIEESSRQYSTGKLVYQYADAYVLMLNTGIRLGEAIGLKKTDWNEKEKTLHVQRNIQSISKRDTEGNRVKGKQLVSNTTKTYSGDRILPLNKAATEALERLCRQHPESEYIVCSSKGEIIPPERLERTFYRILKNVGINQAGTHSLRHTFASMLFANGTDVKTVSELLGHASIQITLNTYVHLIGKPKHDAVVKLDDIF